MWLGSWSARTETLHIPTKPNHQELKWFPRSGTVSQCALRQRFRCGSLQSHQSLEGGENEEWSWQEKYLIAVLLSHNGRFWQMTESPAISLLGLP
jgi:hypothetical protein